MMGFLVAKQMAELHSWSSLKNSLNKHNNPLTPQTFYEIIFIKQLQLQNKH